MASGEQIALRKSVKNTLEDPSVHSGNNKSATHDHRPDAHTNDEVHHEAMMELE